MLGIRASSVRNCDRTGHEYRQDKLTTGIDCYSFLEVGFTGFSTRVCDLMTVLDNCKQDNIPEKANKARLADGMHIVLQGDQMLQI